MIDWSKLRPYQGNRWKSFEVLCYLAARKQFSDREGFTPIDDSGGGNGVEFYLTLPDGTEWGWQAKFYYPNPRLRGRLREIKKSLNRSVKTHRRLRRWFLCTPTDFTNKEKRWFDRLQAEYPDVALDHWGDSEFHWMLSNPHFSGLRNYFFGELELSMEWFRNQVRKQIAKVGGRFISDLHTETNTDPMIHSILADRQFQQELEERISKITHLANLLDKAVDELRNTKVAINWREKKRRFLTYSGDMKKACTEMLEHLTYADDCYRSGLLGQAKKIDQSMLERELIAKIEKYRQELKDFAVSFNTADREQTLGFVMRRIGAVLQKAHEIANAYFDIRSSLEVAETHDLHIFGGAGTGKTHVVCSICLQRVLSGLPAILLLGNHFRSESVVERQILRILDIPESYSWSDFVLALQTAGQAYGTKIPIFIDALNEAQSVDTWRNELPGLIHTLSESPEVVLITTCRSTYRKAIWHPPEPRNAVESNGFGFDSVEEAAKKYFDWYKIKCDMTMAPIRQFAHPIFLRIFCESQNKERRTEKHIYLGEQTLLQVFEVYLDQCNLEVCTRLSRNPLARVVQNSLGRVASEMWERGSSWIRFADAARIIDSADISALDWPSSLTHALLDVGLLVNRDLIDGEEVLFFTYNLLGGYIIAKELANGLTVDNAEEFVGSEKFTVSCLGDNLSDRHPMHEDILRCFALLLPARLGKRLHEITKNETAFHYSIRAFFEMDPELVDEPSRNLITELFSVQEHRRPLLKLARSTMICLGHPLNIEFYDGLLQKLPMPERDLCWTELVREEAADFLGFLDSFEAAVRTKASLTSVSQLRLSLAAKLCSWLLTSTVRFLRDSATRALYWYGRRFPRKLFDLALGYLAVNDPYVPERMLAAAYGVAMALQYDFKRPEFREQILPNYAKRVYNSMFKPSAPYATTHILSRDYARRTIDIALIDDPALLEADEKPRVAPPFAEGGIRDWGESEERDKEDYSSGSAPIHMDFGNYTLGGLVRDRSNYDFDHAEYRKVRANMFWRLYDLGYSHDIFKRIDQEINRYNWSFGISRNGGKVERYGKKYSWIAFYELAGFREDNDLLCRFYSEESRIPDADIDPSFPEPPQEVEIVRTDFFRDPSGNLHEWIGGAEVPDLAPYLIVRELLGELGPWVLLDGYMNQEDMNTNRGQFVFPRGFLVRREDARGIVERLRDQNLGNRWLPEIPEDHYTYAGEIPWCDTFGFDGKRRIEFTVGSRTERKPVKIVARLEDGTPLTASDLFSWVSKTREVQTIGEEAEIELFDRHRVEEVDETVMRDVEVAVKESFEVVIPVRFYSWEAYHSRLNRAERNLVPAKELAESLDLCSQPQTFDLYQKTGMKASITLRWGQPGSTEHFLCYLRQDLLEKYLEGNEKELIWAIWGERQFVSEEIEDLMEFRKQHESSKVFQNITTYAEMKSLFNQQTANCSEHI